MEKLILHCAAKCTCFKQACCALLCVGFFVIPNRSLAQADTSKKLHQVEIKTAPIPQVQTLTPSQQVGVDDFSRYNALTVADAIRNFSGINIKDYGGIGGLKTVSVRSLGANHLGVLFDGIELNDAASGVIDLGRINLYNISDIRVYNGQSPQILQTARAFSSASVLAITPVRPALDSIKPYLVKFGITGGSFGLIEPNIQWQQRISKTWSFVINSYIEKATGQYKYKVDGDASDTLSTRNNSDVNIQQADANLYWVKNEGDQFNLHINYFNSDRGLPGAVIFYNPYSHVRSYDQDFSVQSGYQHSWQNGLQLLINSKYSQAYTRYVDPDFQNGVGGLDEQYTEHEFYQSAALSYHITANWQVSYATDASLSTLATNLPNYAYPTRFTLLNAITSNYTIGKWLFQGSLLATNVNEAVKSGNVASPVSVLSPTLMASIKPLSNLQIRAFYKDIFREPTFDEQYYYAVVQSRNIRPEYAKQFDLGLTYSKGYTGLLNYITLTVDGYYNRVTDKIISIPNRNPVISSVLNLGSVDIKGVDIGIKTQAAFGEHAKVPLSLNYTFQQALDVTDPTTSYYNNQIPYTPMNTLALNTGVAYKRLGIYYNQVLSSQTYFLSDNVPANLVPGYSVSTVTAVYSLGSKNKPVMLAAGVDNIFDVSYSIVRSFPMPGRSVRFSVQITI